MTDLLSNLNTSVVRNNLLTQPGYTPYCGADPCRLRWPRTVWDGAQFKCPCGWRSEFPADFIAEYRAKWLASPSVTEQEKT